VFNTRIPRRVVICTGIYPPDIGGPATHARDLACELRGRGHDVTVITLRDARAPADDHGIVAFARSAPWFVRMGQVVRWLVAHRTSYDIVYATGMQLPAVLAARIARRPVVVKVVGDPAWERGSRLGLTAAGFDEFQRRPPGPWSLRLRLMVAVRNWWSRRADAVVTPSRYLQRVVQGWRGHGRGVIVVPNGVRRRTSARDPAPAGGRALRCIFVGRLIAPKRVDVLVDAVARVPGATLTVVGDGPARRDLEAHAEAIGAPTTFLGALPHDATLDALARSDVFVSATEYEGLPHTMIEALVTGVPVVSSPAGGNQEVVVDGHNGIVVAPPTVGEYARVLAQLRDDRDRLAKLRHGARASAPQWEFTHCADRLEALFGTLGRRPRAVFFGAGAQRHPAGGRKAQVLERYLDPVYVARASGSATLLQRARFYGFGPVAGWRARRVAGLVWWCARAPTKPQRWRAWLPRCRGVCGRASWWKCTATGARPPGSTAGRRARGSRRSPTASPRGHCGAPIGCGSSARSRAGSWSAAGTRARSTSTPRSPTTARSCATRRAHCQPTPWRSSSGRSRPSKASTCCSTRGPTSCGASRTRACGWSATGRCARRSSAVARRATWRRSSSPAASRPSGSRH
jgi:glycosyltransferase involved in cell wall biosynthesis